MKRARAPRVDGARVLKHKLKSRESGTRPRRAYPVVVFVCLFSYSHPLLKRISAARMCAECSLRPRTRGLAPSDGAARASERQIIPSPGERSYKICPMIDLTLHRPYNVVNLSVSCGGN